MEHCQPCGENVSPQGHCQDKGQGENMALGSLYVASPHIEWQERSQEHPRLSTFCKTNTSSHPKQ